MRCSTLASWLKWIGCESTAETPRRLACISNLGRCSVSGTMSSVGKRQLLLTTDAKRRLCSAFFWLMITRSNGCSRCCASASASVNIERCDSSAVMITDRCGTFQKVNSCDKKSLVGSVSSSERM